MDTVKTLAVVGLGYVGLPLACAFSKKFPVIGFDVSREKVEQLKKGIDPTGEMEDLSSYKIDYTTEASALSKAQFIVVAVPTPIDAHNNPDVKYLVSASEIIGKHLSKGTTIVFESTVYPGVTEEVCLPIIEQHSGLSLGKDFKLGYSPERINPGDKEHTVDKIKKVVSGSDAEALETVASVYGSVITAGVFRAASIRVAEAAKVIENIQRDLNIALMNELSIIFHRMGIDTKDVLEAAGTKWNFHKYTPGLVGGHCIGVDPYYLTYKAQELGYHPEVILAGRRINDNMHKEVVELVLRSLIASGKVLKGAEVLIMGLTFKENVNDFRNSRAKQLVEELLSYGLTVYGYDPMLSDEILSERFGVVPVREPETYDAVVLFSPHKAFASVDYAKLFEDGDRILVDVKGVLDRKKLEKAGFAYSRL